MKHCSILVLALIFFVSCEAESEYSALPCYFAYQNSFYLDETLSTAMNKNSRGVFCQISESFSGGVTYLNFKNNYGLSSQKKETALEQGTAYVIGRNNGIIVGFQTMNDMPRDGFVAYDLQCPNCVRRHTSYINPNYRLDMQSSGIAICTKCGKHYDMNNRGVIQDGEEGDVNLTQYVATTTGPQGYLLVRNQ
jgi:DNA-directed RNA polymerase subunit M/transcription elongation factor TFIIS